MTTPTMRIGTREIGPGHPCFVVAEYGISWNGDMAIAKELVEVAARAGCDAVKGQKRTIDVVYTPEQLAAPRPGPWGPTAGDLRRLLEMTPEQCAEIRDLTSSLGMTWSASPWDVASVEVLRGLDVSWVKVASASITDEGLVRACSSLGCPVIMSTGMSTTAEIDRAVEWVGSTPLALLHTCSAYPAEDADLHLSRMGWLRERYPHAVTGYSGHERGVLPSVEAVRLGASIVERHVTLDRSMWGSDQAASLEPSGLRVLVRAIRWLESRSAEERTDVNLSADAVIMAEVAEVVGKATRNRALARLAGGEGGPREVLACEAGPRAKLRRSA